MKQLPLLLSLVFSNLVLAQITFESAFPSISFDAPVEFLHPDDGTDRFFVVEQLGKIKVFPRKSNVVSSEVSTFLDIGSELYVESFRGQELGLLGLAFHPNYENNGYFYVYFTRRKPGTARTPRMTLSRFSVDPNNPNRALPNSEEIIFQVDKNQSNSNHNGGKIGFGPDGYLYISYGDGGGGGDPQGNAQNTNNVFGSISRIDVDIDGDNPIETNPDLPNGKYEIPADNPFLNRAGADEIFAYGIRNTWKFSFDSVTGRMWGADVGQNSTEEINIIENGGNYGWNRFEGSSVFNSSVQVSGDTKPVFEYAQSGGNRSITGGYVYRGSEITSLSPDINSKYIFGDYVSGRVWVLDYNSVTGDASSTLLFDTNFFVSSFGIDINGEMYFSDYSGGKLYKFVDGVTQPSGNALVGEGTWSSLGAEILNGTVNEVTKTANGDVYHVGNFTKVGTLEANRIAIYNDISGWRTLGIGANNEINAIEITSNGAVYVGGSFTEIGGVSTKGIAVWNNGVWSAVGNVNAVDGIVSTMVLDSFENLYIGGIFENLAGNSARNIGKWNGSTWESLVDSNNAIAGLNNEARSLEIDPLSDVLYVGGNFDNAGGNTANRIAVWNPLTSTWSTLGAGTSGFVEAIVATETDVFVGGNFSFAGNTTVNRLARWNKANSSWGMVDNGVSNLVQALEHDGINLYVGGAFDLSSVGNENYIVNKIAKWNVTEGWQSLGGNQVGVDIKVNSIFLDATEDNKIYVAGNFSRAGIIEANKTASWSIEDTLSIPDEVIKTKGNIKLYPNPTSGKSVLSEKVSWQIFDVKGIFLIDGEGSAIDVSEYAPGLYFIKLDNSETIKIIKE